MIKKTNYSLKRPWICYCISSQASGFDLVHRFMFNEAAKIVKFLFFYSKIYKYCQPPLPPQKKITLKNIFDKLVFIKKIINKLTPIPTKISDPQISCDIIHIIIPL